MAAFMEWPWESETRPAKYGACRNRIETVTAEQAHADRMAAYMKSIETRPYREQTHTQFIHECLREGLGLKGKCSEASVKERIQQAIALRPDLYESPQG